MHSLTFRGKSLWQSGHFFESAATSPYMASLSGFSLPALPLANSDGVFGNGSVGVVDCGAGRGAVICRSDSSKIASALAGGDGILAGCLPEGNGVAFAVFLPAGGDSFLDACFSAGAAARGFFTGSTTSQYTPQAEQRTLRRGKSSGKPRRWPQPWQVMEMLKGMDPLVPQGTTQPF